MSSKRETSTGSGLPYMPSDKFKLPKLEALERFGEEASPIPGTSAYVAPINNFSKKDVRAEKWIIINDEGNGGQGTMTFMNTFDGMMGSNQKQATATFPLDPKKLRRKLSEYQAIDISDCPIAATPEDCKKHKTNTELQSTSVVEKHEVNA